MLAIVGHTIQYTNEVEALALRVCEVADPMSVAILLHEAVAD